MRGFHWLVDRSGIDASSQWAPVFLPERERDARVWDQKAFSASHELKHSDSLCESVRSGDRMRSQILRTPNLSLRTRRAVNHRRIARATWSRFAVILGLSEAHSRQIWVSAGSTGGGSEDRNDPCRVALRGSDAGMIVPPLRHQHQRYSMPAIAAHPKAIPWGLATIEAERATT